jgi:predicted lipoprotein with Yx(FWY)xxD motif
MGWFVLDNQGTNRPPFFYYLSRNLFLSYSVLSINRLDIFSHLSKIDGMNALPNSVRNILAIVALTILLLGCDKDTTAPAGVNTDDTINLATTSLGQTLTGVDGKTLYFFAGDADGKTGCNAPECMTNWYTYYTDKAMLKLGTGLTATDFETITRTDGRFQTTYKGWPLYYFKGDAKAGDVLGDKAGNAWFVAKPTYTVMLVNAQLKGLDGKNYVTTTSPAAYAEGTGNTVYLTDANGRTLYGYAFDKKNKNNYTKADFSNDPTWPLYQIATVGDLPSSLNKADFSTIKVFGKDQLTYKGWPLYYFGPDAMVRGVNKGISVPKTGVWPIVNANSPEAP